MKVGTDEHHIYCDIDDTLIMYHNNNTENDVDLVLDGSGLMIHHVHVKMLRDYHAKGYRIILWSAAGALWAETVAKALGIVEIVDCCLTKPSLYVDDLSVNDFMGLNIYKKYNK